MELTTATRAQIEKLYELTLEAEGNGKTVNGVVSGNVGDGIGPTRGARFVLVINDEPQQGTEYDRTFGPDGTEIGRGERSVQLGVEELARTLGILADASVGALADAA